MERVAVDVARKWRWTSSLRKGMGKCLGSGLLDVVVGAITGFWEEVWSVSVSSWVAAWSLKPELASTVKFVRSDVRSCYGDATRIVSHDDDLVIDEREKKWKLGRMETVTSGQQPRGLPLLCISDKDQKGGRRELRDGISPP